jgi:hypothetical protein
MIGEVLAIVAERLGSDRTAVLSRLAGIRVEPAPAPQRRAEILAAARAPIPGSLRAIQPTWIEHALAELGDGPGPSADAAASMTRGRARKVLASPSADPIDIWLARWATHALPPTMSDARLPAIAADHDAAAVADWLGRIGADQMAYALDEQARAVPALAAAVARIAKPPRTGQLGPRRAAIARCRDAPLDDDLSFVLVGCRALAPHLAADQLARLQLILRLPRPIGIMVARELSLHAATSFDQCPSWAALAAQ